MDTVFLVDFTCAKCGKTLHLQQNVYKKAYAGQTLCLDCRADKDGKGAGGNDGCARKH